MNVFRKLAAIGLMLLFTGTPVMACMLPDAQLTAEESACCQQMAHQCGEMGLNSSHSCCTKVVGPDNELMLAGKRLVNFQINTLAVLRPSSVPLMALDAHHLAIEFAHSPPESPPASVSILRI